MMKVKKRFIVDWQTVENGGAATFPEYVGRESFKTEKEARLFIDKLCAGNDIVRADVVEKITISRHSFSTEQGS